MSTEQAETEPTDTVISNQAPFYERCLGFLSTATVSAILVFWSFVRVPIPGVNEPHYFTKAKHFWNPEWCAGDFFLESSNPHYVFYFTTGWLCEFLPLEQVVVVFRVLGFIILGWGWSLLGRSLTGSRCLSIVSLSAFLVLHSLGNWSGEWLVGGIESKVIAYGFLFAAIAKLLDGKVLFSACCAGMAVSFHPVVGAWGALAAGVATLIHDTCFRSCAQVVFSKSRKTLVAALVCFIVLSLPGLIPALDSIGGATPEVEFKANLIQVGSRLAHHLDPLVFSKESYRYFGILIVLWWVLRFKNGSETASPKTNRWWGTFVLTAIIFGLIGVAIGYGPRPLSEMPGAEWRIKALKFYPFRLPDMVVPIAVAFAFAQRFKASMAQNRFTQFGIVILSVGLIAASLFIPGRDQNPSGMDSARRERWIAACHWLRDETAPGDLIYAPNEKWAVKWFTERPEYLSPKDCPQDAAGIIEWNNRRWLLHYWKRDSFADATVSVEELHDLHDKTGIKWVLVSRMGPIEATPVYKNAVFQIYSTVPD